jgi:hypothetical protein
LRWRRCRDIGPLVLDHYQFDRGFLIRRVANWKGMAERQQEPGQHGAV